MRDAPMLVEAVILLVIGTRAVFFTRDMQARDMQRSNPLLARFEKSRLAFVTSPRYFRAVRMAGIIAYAMALLLIFAAWKGRWQ